MKELERIKTRKAKAEAFKKKAVWLLTRPLYPFALILALLEQEHYKRQKARAKKHDEHPWELVPGKAYKYITKMIVDVLTSDEVCIFGFEYYPTDCHYAFQSNRTINNKRIAKWWHRVNYSDLVWYIMNEYDHPELIKYHYRPFYEILKQYTSKGEREFDTIPFDSEEFEPMRKANLEYDEQTKVFEEFLPNWYPGRWEYSAHCVIFRPQKT